VRSSAQVPRGAGRNSKRQTGGITWIHQVQIWASIARNHSSVLESSFLPTMCRPRHSRRATADAQSTAALARDSRAINSCARTAATTTRCTGKGKSDGYIRSGRRPALSRIIRACWDPLSCRRCAGCATQGGLRQMLSARLPLPGIRGKSTALPELRPQLRHALVGRAGGTPDQRVRSSPPTRPERARVASGPGAGLPGSARGLNVDFGLEDRHRLAADPDRCEAGVGKFQLDVHAARPMQ
jgi:hypothetical protein